MAIDKVDDVLPFHEWIVEVIRSVRGCEIPTIVFVICGVKIPAGHDAIIEAIEGVWDKYGFYPDKSARAKEHVLAQKRLAEEKATKKAVEAREKQVVDELADTVVFQVLNQ